MWFLSGDVEKSDALLSRIIVALIGASILLLPIYKGGYRGVPTGLFFIVTSILLCLHSLRADDKANEKPWLLVWLFASLGIFIKPLSLWPELMNGFKLQSSVDIADLYTWGFFTSTWLVALLVSKMQTKQLQWVLFSILLSSSFQALYGLYHFASDSSSVLGLWEKQFYLDSVTGTFVNRNVYAGMLVFSWSLCLAAMVTRQLPGMSKWPVAAVIVCLLIYSGLMLIALLLTKSRMGFAVGVIGVFTFSVVYARNIASSSSVASFVTARYFPFLLMFLIILFVLWFGVGEIGDRYTRLESGDSRLEIWKSILSLPSELWVKGIGAGAFNDVFNQVRPLHYNVEMRYAHNDYLQFVLQFGLAWSVIILVSFVFFMIKCMPRRGWGMRSGALGTLTALAIHSIVDSNLQIPGSALIAWVAFGILMNPNLAEKSAPIEVRENNQDLNDAQKSHKVKRKKRHTSSRSTKRDWLNKCIKYFQAD